MSLLAKNKLPLSPKDTQTESVSITPPCELEKLAAVIEATLAPSGDRSSGKPITIPLAELADCLGSSAPKLNEILPTLMERFHLNASSATGPNGPELILEEAPLNSLQQQSPALHESASMRAFGLLLEDKTKTLSKERWSSAIQDRSTCNGVLIALTPQVRQICSDLARSKGIPLTQELLAEGQFATYKLLSSYDPQRASLATFLKHLLVPRMTDVLRTETGGRARSDFQEKVAAAQHVVQQRDSRPVAEHDPAIAEELGMPAKRFNRLAARHLRSERSGTDPDTLHRERGASNINSSALPDTPLQPAAGHYSALERKIISLRVAGYPQRTIGYILDLSQSVVSETLATVKQRMANSVDASTLDTPQRGLGFEVLAREVEVTGRPPSTWSELTDYIDGLSFFSQLKISHAPFAQEFKARWCGPNDSFRYDSLPAESQQVIAETVRALAPTIDTLPDHYFFGDLFGLPSRSLTLSTTARLCIQHGILSAKRPYGYPFSPLENGGRRSRFFEADIVSPRVAHENIISFMRELYPTPDCIRRDLPGTAGLLELLGFGGAKGALAKWGLEHSVWPRSWPKGHPLLKGNSNTPSVLLQPEINGPVHAAACLSAAFLEAYPHIDAVSRSGAFAALFKVEEQAEQIARAALAAGIPVPTTRPSGYLLSRQMAPRARELAFFYRPEIVGHEIARSNLHRYIEEMVAQPADLKSLMLARALNATRTTSEPLLQEGVYDAQALRVAIRARGLATP